MSVDDTERNILAAVDIGSYSIKMKIAETGPGGGINTLEAPRRLINLGRDTFVTGTVKHENIEEICTILKGFKKLIADYRVEKYKIVATSALREASNCDYILDYIYQKTGLKIKIISESEERYFTYSAIIDSLEEFPELKREGVLIADVSSGGVETTLFLKGDLVFTQYIKMGSLRLREILSDLERKTLDFPRLIGEFIESELDTVKVILTQNAISNFLVIGSEIQVVYDILENRKKESNRLYLSRESFYKVYRRIIGKSQQQITDTFGLDPEKVLTLVPAMLMYEKFLSFTSSDRIYTPPVSLCDGLIRNMTDTRYKLENRAMSEKDIVTSIKKLGERYSYDEKHAEQVESISLMLFDSSKKLHGYSGRERLLLQIASIAHDFGKYINVKAHNILSHDIIINSEILGLSKKETAITADIIRYHSSVAENSDLPDDFNYKILDYESRIMVSKLAAFLKIADALDRSHRQKLSGIRINAADRAFVIKADTAQDALLEEWEFEKKSALFREVYGIKPSLVINRK